MSRVTPCTSRGLSPNDLQGLPGYRVIERTKTMDP